MRRIFGCLMALMMAVSAGANHWIDTQEAVLRKAETAEKVVAITVDDGPYPEATERILDTLDRHGVKATFFALGRSVEAYPKLMARTIEAGHEIATHGYSHRNMARLSHAECLEEWARAEQALATVGVRNVTLFRPPSGAYGECLLTGARKHGYRVVLWSVDPRDWEGAPSDVIAERILGEVHNGAIILLHDGQYPIHSADALDIVIPQLKQKGYLFVTVGELIERAACGS